MRDLIDTTLYKNDEVVFRFAEDYGVSIKDSQDIFEETLKWLWLCSYQAKRAESESVQVVDVPLLGEFFIIDLMWHNFLLFTQDYSEFCQQYLSEFIHHHPQTRAEKETWAKRFAEDPVATRTEREELVYKAYEVIYDILGEETLLKWTEEFPERFKQLQKS